VRARPFNRDSLAAEKRVNLAKNGARDAVPANAQGEEIMLKTIFTAITLAVSMLAAQSTEAQEGFF
jgi:hypothetical protein